MPKLFCYGTLNVHAIQRELWGEAKDGVAGVLMDYEVKCWDSSAILYVEKCMGEKVSGIIYDITTDQIRQSDLYEGSEYERVFIDGDFWVYVRKDTIIRPAPIINKKLTKRERKALKRARKELSDVRI